jgi:hypothetical protein
MLDALNKGRMFGVYIVGGQTESKCKRKMMPVIMMTSPSANKAGMVTCTSVLSSIVGEGRRVTVQDPLLKKRKSLYF